MHHTQVLQACRIARIGRRYLATKSQEQLNCLHQVASARSIEYTTFFLAKTVEKVRTYSFLKLIKEHVQIYRLEAASLNKRETKKNIRGD
jgi:hypothetical protein